MKETVCFVNVRFIESIFSEKYSPGTKLFVGCPLYIIPALEKMIHCTSNTFLKILQICNLILTYIVKKDFQETLLKNSYKILVFLDHAQSRHSINKPLSRSHSKHLLPPQTPTTGRHLVPKLVVTSYEQDGDGGDNNVSKPKGITEKEI